MTAKEELDVCCRKCGCLCRRDFDLDLNDGSGNKVYQFYHPMICCSWLSCCGCCRHRLQVKRAGNTVGWVERDCRICCTCYPRFSVTDSKGQNIYSISKDVDCCTQCCGNCCNCCCCASNSPTPLGYTIEGKNGRPSKGIVQKEQTALHAAGTDDVFGVKFPDGSSEEDRLLLVAAAIIIDYALYDEPVAPEAQKMK